MGYGFFYILGKTNLAPLYYLLHYQNVCVPHAVNVHSSIMSLRIVLLFEPRTTYA
jgi:hypothetical protein